MTPNFFRLPRELRDEIYHHVWSSLRRIRLPYSVKRGLPAFYIPSSSDQWDPLLRIPRGLSASKTLLAEALEALHRKAVVSMESSTYEHLESSATRIRPAVVPAAIQASHVRIPANFFKDDAWGPNECISARDAAFVKSLVIGNEWIGSPRILQVHLKGGYFKRGNVLPDGAVDFSPIAWLMDIADRLDRLEFVVDLVDGMLLMNPTLREAIYTEVRTLVRAALPSVKMTVTVLEEGERKEGNLKTTRGLDFTKV